MRERERDPALAGSWSVHVDLVNLWVHVFAPVKPECAWSDHSHFISWHLCPPYNLRVTWPY